MRLQTTSLNLYDAKIIEYCFLKIDRGKIIGKLDGLLDPGVSISIDAQNHTGINEEMVKGQKKFGDVALDILDFIESCPLAGFKIVTFDIPILINEFKRCCNVDASFLEELPIIDSEIIFKRFHLGINQILKRYTNKSLGERHNIYADIQAIMLILATQMKWYSELADVDSINHFCLQPDKYLDRQKRLRYDVEGELVFNFGRFSGHKVKEVRKKNPWYLQWILKKGDFSRRVKAVCYEMLNS